MKVICEKDLLLKGLNTVSRAVPTKTTIDILKCIVLDAESDELKMTANDQSLGIEKRIAATVEEPGTLAIDAILFLNIVRKLPENEVTIEANSASSVKITCENIKFVIAGMGSEDFISLPEVEASETIKVSQFTVREMINQVIFSCADNDVNPAMNGIYLQVLDNKLRMTTLDGHRISVRVNELKSEYKNKNAIIPRSTLSHLSKIATGDLDEEMSISFSKNHIVFEFEGTKMISRVIDGEYFKIDSMLKEEHETHFVINKKQFLECLDRSSLLINESDKKPVIMTIRENEMELRLKSAIGSMDDCIPIEKDGKDLKIAFNPRLLVDALRVIEDEKIDIYMVKHNYPCTIRNESGSYFYVILPVNFTED